MPATRVFYDGIWHASMAEAGYYIYLKSEEGKGYISHLTLQPRWDMYARGMQGEAIKIGHYTADFMFYDHRVSEYKVIDVKGQIPHRNKSGNHVSGGRGWTAFMLRCKMVKANHGVEVEVVAGAEYTKLYQRVTGIAPKRKRRYVRGKR